MHNSWLIVNSVYNAYSSLDDQSLLWTTNKITGSFTTDEENPTTWEVQLRHLTTYQRQLTYISESSHYSLLSPNSVTGKPLALHFPVSCLRGSVYLPSSQTINYSTQKPKTACSINTHLITFQYLAYLDMLMFLWYTFYKFTFKIVDRVSACLWWVCVSFRWTHLNNLSPSSTFLPEFYTFLT